MTLELPQKSPSAVLAERMDELDNIAMTYLAIDHQDLQERRLMRDLQSVYYLEKEHDGALIVCRDNSVLFASRLLVPYQSHRLAFKEGLRSSKELLLERKSGL